MGRQAQEGSCNCKLVTFAASLPLHPGKTACAERGPRSAGASSRRCRAERPRCPTARSRHSCSRRARAKVAPESAPPGRLRSSLMRLRDATTSSGEEGRRTTPFLGRALPTPPGAGSAAFGPGPFVCAMESGCRAGMRARRAPGPRRASAASLEGTRGRAQARASPSARGAGLHGQGLLGSTRSRAGRRRMARPRSREWLPVRLARISGRGRIVHSCSEPGA